MTRVARVAFATAAVLAAASCGEGSPSALDPAGPGARRVEGLWWLLLWVSVAVLAVVVAFLAVAWARGRGRGDVVERPRGELFVVVAGVVVPLAILTTVFVISLDDMAALSRPRRDARLTIEVVGHDWWWEVRYPNGAVTANEIHVPVGEPVALELTTGDVIHSFWVPQLMPKTDHIPGRVNHTWIEADRPGRYRGQCAEFCGLQHAHMAMYVVARPRAEFDRWVAQQAAPRAEPSGAAARGEEVFMSTTCFGCHAVRGTPAHATAGPDLTHLASRDTIAAGTLPNTRAALRRFVLDPQGVKPGVAMPPTALAPDDLDALLDYLEALD